MAQKSMKSASHRYELSVSCRIWPLPGVSKPHLTDRLPWEPGLDISVGKNIYPFENHKRYAQLRLEAFNALNHTWFTTNPNSSFKVFNSQPTISRTGLSLAGQIPYLIWQSAASFAAGTRNYYIAQTYNVNFGVLNMGNNNPGRTISLALKLNW